MAALKMGFLKQGYFKIKVMTSPAKIYHVTQSILYMWSSNQNSVTLAFIWGKLSQPQLNKYLTKKTTFLQGQPWFQFNYLGLTLGMRLKF